MDLYFECGSGISGDMSVGALLDLGASRDKLETALKSLALNEEFAYKINEVKVNSIKATDFNVIIKEHHHKHSEHHHHKHRNLSDVISIIDKAETTDSAKTLQRKFLLLLQKLKVKFMVYR